MMRVEELRPAVEQLRIESSMRRQKTSKTIEELHKFILTQQYSDRLVTGFAKNANPYKVKGVSCELI